MLSELDQIANQNHLQLVKAIIPHLPKSRQKMFSVLVKVIEIQNVLNYYSRTSPSLRGCTTPKGTAFGTVTDESGADLFSDPCREPKSSPCPDAAAGQPSDLLDILTDIREHCEGEEQAMIDQALQMLSMIELYSLFAQQEGESHE